MAADVWSATSYKSLYTDAADAERWNALHPGEKPQAPHVARCLSKEKGVFVAASDYVKLLPASVGRWVPGPFLALGTDGFGRSDGRAALRDFFEVDAAHIAFGALSLLAREKAIGADVVLKAQADLGIDPEKPNPVWS